MKSGWVKNGTNRPQMWGNLTLPVGGVDLMPPEVVDSVRLGTVPGLVVLDDHEDMWVFAKTEHKPFGQRYLK